MPEHLNYLMRYFIADARLSPQEQAIRLRNFACVSRMNYAESLRMLKEKGYEAVSLCSTRFAVPDFFRFKDGDKNRKHKARLRIAQLVSTHGYSYIDLSQNWKSLPNQKGLRAAATVGLFSAGDDKWLRIDLSNYRLSTFMQGSAYPKLSAVDWGKLVQDSLAVIARALRHNAFLERLDLSRNPLCHLPTSDRTIMGGIRALNKSLLTNTKLARLNLSSCGIDDKAADELLLALTKNKTLQFIDLTGNSINEEHAIFTDARVVDRYRPAYLQNGAKS